MAMPIHTEGKNWGVSNTGTLLMVGERSCGDAALVCELKVMLAIGQVEEGLAPTYLKVHSHRIASSKPPRIENLYAVWPWSEKIDDQKV